MERTLSETPEPDRHILCGELEDLRETLSNSLAEIAEVVKKLVSIKVPGADEIHSEILKALDIVTLFWLKHLFSVTQRSGTVPVEWQTGVMVSNF